MDPVWVGLIGTLVVQVVVAVFVVGKWSERFDHLQKFIDEEAKPQLDDHENRIVTLEVIRRGGGRN
jgi:hypothetical protein